MGEADVCAEAQQLAKRAVSKQNRAIPYLKWAICFLLDEMFLNAWIGR